MGSLFELLIFQYSPKGVAVFNMRQVVRKQHADYTRRRNVSITQRNADSVFHLTLQIILVGLQLYDYGPVCTPDACGPDYDVGPRSTLARDGPRPLGSSGAPPAVRDYVCNPVVYRAFNGPAVAAYQWAPPDCVPTNNPVTSSVGWRRWSRSYEMLCMRCSV